MLPQFPSQAPGLHSWEGRGVTPGTNSLHRDPRRRGCWESESDSGEDMSPIPWAMVSVWPGHLHPPSRVRRGQGTGHPTWPKARVGEWGALISGLVSSSKEPKGQRAPSPSGGMERAWLVPCPPSQVWPELPECHPEDGLTQPQEVPDNQARLPAPLGRSREERRPRLVHQWGPGL